MTLVSVGFSTSTHLVSRIIRWFTDAPASHVWLTFNDPVFADMQMVLEASGRGFRLVPFQTFLLHNRIIAVVPLQPHPGLPVGLAYLGAWLGTDYDATGLLGMAWVSAGRWLRMRWRNPWASSRGMFCTEAVVRMLQAALYPGASTLDPDATLPTELLAFLGRSGAGTRDVVV